MDKLFDRINWFGVKMFLVGLACALVYGAGADFYHRLVNLEQMQYMMYQAMTGQHN